MWLSSGAKGHLKISYLSAISWNRRILNKQLSEKGKIVMTDVGNLKASVITIIITNVLSSRVESIFLNLQMHRSQGKHSPPSVLCALTWGSDVCSRLGWTAAWDSSLLHPGCREHVLVMTVSCSPIPSFSVGIHQINAKELALRKGDCGIASRCFISGAKTLALEHTTD